MRSTDKMSWTVHGKLNVNKQCRKCNYPKIEGEKLFNIEGNMGEGTMLTLWEKQSLTSQILGDLDELYNILARTHFLDKLLNIGNSWLWDWGCTVWRVCVIISSSICNTSQELYRMQTKRLASAVLQKASDEGKIKVNTPSVPTSIWFPHEPLAPVKPCHTF